MEACGPPEEKAQKQLFGMSQALAEAAVPPGDSYFEDQQTGGCIKIWEGGTTKERHYKTGRKSMHNLLQTPTTALSSALCNFYVINLCVCPVFPSCRGVLDRAWEKPPHSHCSAINDWFHRTVQTCPTMQRETSDSRFFAPLCISKNPMTWSI